MWKYIDKKCKQLSNDEITLIKQLINDTQIILNIVEKNHVIKYDRYDKSFYLRKLKSCNKILEKVSENIKFY